jgi:glycosyltransferase involved in cell wall biosynthesis
VKQVTLLTDVPEAEKYAGLAKYQDAVAHALTEVGVPFRFLQHANGYGTSRGAYVNPVIDQIFNRSPNGGLTHAIAPRLAWKGTQVVSLHFAKPHTPWWDPRVRLMRMADSMGLQHAKVVLTHTQGEVDAARDTWGDAVADKCINVAMSMDPRYYFYEERERPFDLMWVGKSTPNKRFDRFAELCRKIPSAKCLAISTLHGRFKEIHEADIRLARSLPNLTFYGDWVSDEQLSIMYRSSKAIVSTSVAETLHQPIYEAYLCGCTPVVPKKLPYTDLLSTEEAEFYSPPAGEWGTPSDVSPGLPDMEGAAQRALRRMDRRPSDRLVRLFSEKEFGLRLVEAYAKAEA